MANVRQVAEMDGVASGLSEAGSSSVYPHIGVWFVMGACECRGMIGVLVSVPVRHET